ncbi:unnamed protein product [Parajaminaea phylloscopi]
MTATGPVLSPGVGAAVVVSVAVGLSVLMLLLLLLMKRYAPTTGLGNDNDEFSSASRSVKPGLVACAIVSAWTWAATLEQSAAVAYKWGISGPFWYAAGASVQVFLFALISSNLKLNAPFANTFLQVVRARWGTLCHVVFTCCALAANVLVSSMLILGGSAAVEHLTGLNIYISIFVTPIGLTIFVLLGGLRASFIADYTHTAVLIAIILTFAFTVYATSDKIGSFSKMVELLSRAPPVEGNAGGSYLTFRSLSGLQFGIINIVGNLGALFLDQSYHQRAIASRGETATKGFILGGLAWIGVPLGIASCLGLAGRALAGQDPAMAVLTADEISQGLPAPAAAAALLGKSGALMMLFLLFLAVTSAASAQLVAVSSVFTFDIYQPYIHPTATARRLFVVSHAAVVAWAFIMGILGVIWYHIGVSMGWLYTAMGIFIGPFVVATFCCTAWSKANRRACLFGSLLGEALGLTAWLVSAKALEGEISIASTGANGPLLAANLIGVVFPALVIVPASLLWPANYDWEATRAINAPWTSLKGDDATSGSNTPDGSTKASHSLQEHSTEARSGELQAQVARPDDEKRTIVASGPTLASEDYLSHRLTTLRNAGIDPEMLLRSRALAIKTALPLTFILLVLVPCMAIIPREWSVTGLGVWVSIVIGWLFVTGCIVVLYPLYESREALGKAARGILADIKSICTSP